LLIESLTLYQEQGIKGGMLECLEGLAGLAAVEGEAADAARLLGAVEALREDSGLQMSVAHGTLFAHWMEQARARLDDDHFRLAWNVGRAMSADEAIVFALR
jgi:hypothetical protein